MGFLELVITVCAHRTPDALRRSATSVRVKSITATVRHGRSALHCAMDRRTSEMDGGALALRILRPEKDLMLVLDTR